MTTRQADRVNLRLGRSKTQTKEQGLKEAKGGELPVPEDSLNENSVQM